MTEKPGEPTEGQIRELVPEELEKARAYLSSKGYNLDYEMVQEVIKAYLQAIARR